MRSAHPDFFEDDSEDYVASGAACDNHVDSLGDLGNKPSAESDLE